MFNVVDRLCLFTQDMYNVQIHSHDENWKHHYPLSPTWRSASNKLTCGC